MPEDDLTPTERYLRRNGIDSVAVVNDQGGEDDPVETEERSLDSFDDDEDSTGSSDSSSSPPPSSSSPDPPPEPPETGPSGVPQDRRTGTPTADPEPDPSSEPSSSDSSTEPEPTQEPPETGPAGVPQDRRTGTPTAEPNRDSSSSSQEAEPSSEPSSSDSSTEPEPTQEPPETGPAGVPQDRRTGTPTADPESSPSSEQTGSSGDDSSSSETPGEDSTEFDDVSETDYNVPEAGPGGIPQGSDTGNPTADADDGATPSELLTGDGPDPEDTSFSSTLDEVDQSDIEGLDIEVDPEGDSPGEISESLQSQLTEEVPGRTFDESDVAVTTEQQGDQRVVSVELNQAGKDKIEEAQQEALRQSAAQEYNEAAPEQNFEPENFTAESTPEGIDLSLEESALEETIEGQYATYADRRFVGVEVTPENVTADSEDGSIDTRFDFDTRRALAGEQIDEQTQSDVSTSDVVLQSGGTFGLRQAAAREEAATQLDEETSTSVTASDVVEEDGSFQLSDDAQREEARTVLAEDLSEESPGDVDPANIQLQETEDGGFRGTLSREFQQGEQQGSQQVREFEPTSGEDLPDDVGLPEDVRTSGSVTDAPSADQYQFGQQGSLENLVDTGEDVGDATERVVGEIDESLTVSNAQTFTASAIASVSGAPGEFEEDITGVIGEATEPVTGAPGEVEREVRETISDVGSEVVEAGAEAGETAVETGQEAVETGSEVVNEGVEAGVEAGEEAVEAAEPVVDPAVGAAEEVAETGSEVANETVEAGVEAGEEAVEAAEPVTEPVAEGVEEVAEGAETVAQPVIGPAGSVEREIRRGAAEVIDETAATVDEAGDQAERLAEETAAGAEEAAQPVLGAPGDVESQLGTVVFDTAEASRDVAAFAQAEVADPVAGAAGDIAGETAGAVAGDSDAASVQAVESGTENLTQGAVGVVPGVARAPATIVGLGTTVGGAAQFTASEISEDGPVSGTADAFEAGGEAAGRAAVDAAETVASNPLQAVGSLAGSAALFRGAAAVGSRTGLASRAALQPGEELAGFIGNRALRRAPGDLDSRLFPDSEPVVLSEEAGIRAARSARERFRGAGDRVRDIPTPGNRGQADLGQLFTRSESESDSDTVEITAEDIEADTGSRLADDVQRRTSDLDEIEPSDPVDPDVRSVESQDPETIRTVTEQEDVFVADTEADTSRSGPTASQERAFQSSLSSETESDLSPRERQLQAQRGETETETTTETTQETRQRVEEAETPMVGRTGTAVRGAVDTVRGTEVVERVDAAQRREVTEDTTTEQSGGFRSELREESETVTTPGFEVEVGTEPATDVEVGTDVFERVESAQETRSRARTELRSETRSRQGLRSEQELGQEPRLDTETGVEQRTDTEFDTETETEVRTETRTEVRQELFTEQRTENAAEPFFDDDRDDEEEIFAAGSTAVEFQNPIASGTDVLGVGGSSGRQSDTTQEFDATAGDFDEDAATDFGAVEQRDEFEQFDATPAEFGDFDEEESPFVL